MVMTSFAAAGSEVPRQASEDQINACSAEQWYLDAAASPAARPQASQPCLSVSEDQEWIEDWYIGAVDNETDFGQSDCLISVQYIC